MSHFKPLRYTIVGWFGGMRTTTKTVEGFAARHTFGHWRVCVRCEGRGNWSADHWDSGMLVTGGWPTRESAWRAAQLVLACRKTRHRPRDHAERLRAEHIRTCTALVAAARGAGALPS